MHIIIDNNMSTVPQHQSLPQIVTLAEIEEIVSSPKFATNLIEAIKQGFVSYSNDEFNAFPIQTMGALPMKAFGDNNNSNNSNYSAQTCVKSGYVSNATHYIIKVAKLKLGYELVSTVVT